MVMRKFERIFRNHQYYFFVAMCGQEMKCTKIVNIYRHTMIITVAIPRPLAQPTTLACTLERLEIQQWVGLNYLINTFCLPRGQA